MYVACAFCSTSASELDAKEEKLRADRGSAVAEEEGATRGVCSKGDEENSCFGACFNVATGVAGVM